MPPKDKYSDPKLRDEIKEEIHNSDKGGAPGQWSARKAQMMASEYKKRGGKYNTDKSEKDESQKHLSKWGDEDWQTKEGSGDAKQDDGTQKRYLPKKAWEKMSEDEKNATEEEKEAGSKQGKQHVGNTEAAKKARKEADEEEEDGQDGQKKGEHDKQTPKAGSRSSPRKRKTKDDESQEDEEQIGKAKRERKDSASPTKKQKNASSKQEGEGPTHGSKHDSAEPPKQNQKAGSATRLPKKGQVVAWKAMPGWVEGEVVEVLKKDKTVDKKKVKATAEDPRIVLKSHGPSGKTAVHKPEVVYFD